MTVLYRVLVTAFCMTASLQAGDTKRCFSQKDIIQEDLARIVSNYNKALHKILFYSGDATSAKNAQAFKSNMLEELDNASAAIKELSDIFGYFRPQKPDPDTDELPEKETFEPLAEIIQKIRSGLGAAFVPEIAFTGGLEKIEELKSRAAAFSEEKTKKIIQDSLELFGMSSLIFGSLALPEEVTKKAQVALGNESSIQSKLEIMVKHLATPSKNIRVTINLVRGLAKTITRELAKLGYREINNILETLSQPDKDELSKVINIESYSKALQSLTIRPILPLIVTIDESRYKMIPQLKLTPPIPQTIEIVPGLETLKDLLEKAMCINWGGRLKQAGLGLAQSFLGAAQTWAIPNSYRVSIEKKLDEYLPTQAIDLSALQNTGIKEKYTGIIGSLLDYKTSGDFLTWLDENYFNNALSIKMIAGHKQQGIDLSKGLHIVNTVLSHPIIGPMIGILHDIEKKQPGATIDTIRNALKTRLPSAVEAAQATLYSAVETTHNIISSSLTSETKKRAYSEVAGISAGVLFCKEIIVKLFHEQKNAFTIKDKENPFLTLISLLYFDDKAEKTQESGTFNAIEYNNAFIENVTQSSPTQAKMPLLLHTEIVSTQLSRFTQEIVEQWQAQEKTKRDTLELQYIYLQKTVPKNDTQKAFIKHCYEYKRNILQNREQYEAFLRQKIATKLGALEQRKQELTKDKPAREDYFEKKSVNPDDLNKAVVTTQKEIEEIEKKKIQTPPSYKQFFARFINFKSVKDWNEESQKLTALRNKLNNLTIQYTRLKPLFDEVKNTFAEEDAELKTIEPLIETLHIAQLRLEATPKPQAPALEQSTPSESRITVSEPPSELAETINVEPVSMQTQKPLQLEPMTPTIPTESTTPEPIVSKPPQTKISAIKQQEKTTTPPTSGWIPAWMKKTYSKLLSGTAQ
jgi:hypothetical protein